MRTGFLAGTIMFLIAAAPQPAQGQKCGGCYETDPCVLGCPEINLEDCGPCWNTQHGCMTQPGGCFAQVDLAYGVVLLALQDDALLNREAIVANATSSNTTWSHVEIDGHTVTYARRVCDGAIVARIYSAPYIAHKRRATSTLSI
jgi:hypothetical protein